MDWSCWPQGSAPGQVVASAVAGSWRAATAGCTCRRCHMNAAPASRRMSQTRLREKKYTETGRIPMHCRGTWSGMEVGRASVPGRRERTVAGGGAPCCSASCQSRLPTQWSATMRSRESGFHRGQHQGAWAASGAESSWRWPLLRKLRRRHSGQGGSPGAAVAAWLLPAGVAAALAVAMTTGGVVTGDSGQLRRLLGPRRGRCDGRVFTCVGGGLVAPRKLEQTRDGRQRGLLLLGGRRGRRLRPLLALVRGL